MSSQVKSYDLYTMQQKMLEEVIAGLSKPKKTLHAKYFYDQTGSELFEQITQQPEYYPTRTELTILMTHQTAIADRIGPVHTLIEYGSGSSRKIKSLLNSLHQLEEYVPIDISKDYLLLAATELAKDYPNLKIKAVCGDYSTPITLPVDPLLKKVIFFPGSTIGNFDPDEAGRFLQNSAQLLKDGDGFLVGVDTKKEPELLNLAYNDGAGVTKAFNLNILKHINTVLAGTFDPSCFEHVAFYNEEEGRIEMHIKSQIDQTVQVSGHAFTFKEGETIHTENSYKYSIEEFQLLANTNGFRSVTYWTDPNGHFSVHYLEKTST
ncbi:L-histidine N(alpha)-methyltransferase [Exiguobacterium sp. s193]|uniref:L-histidine N(alpha)-methyltransferase n=1 Tax=Exiguobacterium sp. s193 TaxID=2751207 RepID=UPI001BEB3642|nr:L-histidine N(alpha)-methyltransferase [Exiguobacterium sp. s193]